MCQAQNKTAQLLSESTDLDRRKSRGVSSHQSENGHNLIIYPEIMRPSLSLIPAASLKLQLTAKRDQSSLFEGFRIKFQ